MIQFDYMFHVSTVRCTVQLVEFLVFALVSFSLCSNEVPLNVVHIVQQLCGDVLLVFT